MAVIFLTPSPFARVVFYFLGSTRQNSGGFVNTWKLVLPILYVSLLAPSPPRELSVKLKEGTRLILQWKKPEETNGIIKKYEIHFTDGDGATKTYTSHSDLGKEYQTYEVSLTDVQMVYEIKVWIYYYNERSWKTFKIKGFRCFLLKRICLSFVSRWFAQSKIIRIPKSRNLLPVKSAIMGIGIRNSANHCKPEPKFHWQGIWNLLQYLKSGVYRVDSRLQPCLWSPYMI